MVTSKKRGLSAESRTLCGPRKHSAFNPPARNALMFAAVQHLAELGVVPGICERFFSRNYPGPHILYEALVHGLHAPVSLHTCLADLAVDIFRFAILQHFSDGWSDYHDFE